MKILEATTRDRSETHNFNAGSRRITYALPWGSQFLSFTDGRLFYSCDENEPSNVRHSFFLWIVPADAKLPPGYLKYLGTDAKSTTPIHYFEETFEPTDHFRHGT